MIIFGSPIEAWKWKQNQTQKWSSDFPGSGSETAPLPHHYMTPLTKLLQQLQPNSKAAAKTATLLLNYWMDFQTSKNKIIRIEFPIQ